MGSNGQRLQLHFVLTMSIIGYGDIVPVTKGGKLFATVYILVAGTILLNNMSLISMIPLELRKRRIERAVLNQFGDRLDDAALEELATGPVIQRLRLSEKQTHGLNECTREMFSLAMLVRLGKVSEQDIKQTFAAFRRLDVYDEGVLNSKTIIDGMVKRRREQSLSVQNSQDRQAPPPPPPSTHARVEAQHGSVLPYQPSLHPPQNPWSQSNREIHQPILPNGAMDAHQVPPHYAYSATETTWSNEQAALIPPPPPPPPPPPTARSRGVGGPTTPQDQHRFYSGYYGAFQNVGSDGSHGGPPT